MNRKLDEARQDLLEARAEYIKAKKAYYGKKASLSGRCLTEDADMQAEDVEEGTDDEHRMDIADAISDHRAEYENALDDLYYGYGYKFWRTHNNDIEDDEVAKAVWKAAVDKMARS